MSNMQIEIAFLGTSGSASPDLNQDQYQTLIITQQVSSQPISPAQLSTIILPPDVDLNREVVIYGSLPVWVYGRLVDLCISAPWIGCYDVRMGGIVVTHSRVEDYIHGDLIVIQQNQFPCPTILICGPPNSGKSAFSNALRSYLMQVWPQCKTYLHRASWDGENNWLDEDIDTSMGERAVRYNEFRIHEDPESAKLMSDYFQHHAKVVQNLRMLSDYVLVDAGGIPQPEKQLLIQQCTHYIVISRLPAAIEDWHKLCALTLEPIIVIHSVSERTQNIIQKEPFLEVAIGPWMDISPVDFPSSILDRCLSILSD